jgi:phosphoglycolate phosphatase
MIRHVIWDWNGTLLDDVDCCVATLNSLRAERGMPLVSRAEYRAGFGFPVQAYYQAIGFDFAVDDFATLSRDFHARYRARAAEMRVVDGARELLGALAGRGIGHLVISAMETGLLGQMLAEHAISPLLAGWHGRDDQAGVGKVELGASAVSARALDPAELLVVGDTLHDLELAQAIGCRALLYAGGHQSRERLDATGTPVVDSLVQIAARL